MHERQRFRKVVDRANHLVGMAHPADAALGGFERTVRAQPCCQQHQDGKGERDFNFVAAEKSYEMHLYNREPTIPFVYSLSFYSAYLCRRILYKSVSITESGPCKSQRSIASGAKNARSCRINTIATRRGDRMLHA